MNKHTYPGPKIHTLDVMKVLLRDTPYAYSTHRHLIILYIFCLWGLSLSRVVYPYNIKPWRCRTRIFQGARVWFFACLQWPMAMTSCWYVMEIRYDCDILRWWMGSSTLVSLMFKKVCSKKHQPFPAAQGDDGSTQSNQTLAPTVTAATGAADRAETLPSVSLMWRSTDATGVLEGLVVYGYFNLFEWVCSGGLWIDIFFLYIHYIHVSTRIS